MGIRHFALNFIWKSALIAVLINAVPFGLSGQVSYAKRSVALGQASMPDKSTDFYLVVHDTTLFEQHMQAFPGASQVVRCYAPAKILQVHLLQHEFLDTLLQWPEVVFADRVPQSAWEEMPVPGHNLTVNQINVMQQQFPDYTGAGITVSVKENRFDTTDVDLRGRVRPALNASGQFTSHASIMASLIAGAGTSDNAGRGVAPGAQLASADFANLLPDAPSIYTNQGISIQNHSYGVGIENFYGADAMAYDNSVLEQPYLLHVFSAGNKGDGASALGSYQQIAGFANLTGSFKMAKNVLTVGAVDSFGKVLAYSSRGPAYDGRVKPDLVAFGQDGSSGAAALVSGACAVLQQVYASAHNGDLPPAALLRAVLINSARDIYSPGPDFISGFGNLEAAPAVRTLLDNRYWEGTLAQGMAQTHEIAVPASQALLRVTLTWDDPPAQAGASSALVNDLDITLTGPDGQSEWLPWRLRTAPFADSLELPATRGRDSINNVEQITIDFPEPGVYQVSVYGSKILDKQSFALAYDLKSDRDFTWILPQRESPLVSGQTTLMRWIYSGKEPTGRLEFRPDTLLDWQVIDTAVELQSNAYRWTAPSGTALAQVRMVVSGTSFPGDPFLLAPELHLRIGFDCPDDVMLYWNSAGSGVQYQLWGLGDFYLEPLFITADTFVVLPKNLFPQTHFAVSTIAGPGVGGWRSAAPAIDNQGIGCYFSTFIAELNPAAQVDLRLILGTTYQLQQVNFERWTGNGFQPLENWLPPFSKTIFQGLDPNPATGINRYRASLTLESGTGLNSDTALVYYTGQNAFRVFPNPVSGGNMLQVISQELPDNTVFILFNCLGQRLLEKKMEDALENIALPVLLPGPYPFAIRNNSGYLYRGIVLLEP